MSAGEEEPRRSGEKTIRRLRNGIRMAQLRVVLDQAQGRPTPEAVLALAQLTMPPLPSPLDFLRSEDGKLRADQASQREIVRLVRRSIRMARLKIVLDERQDRPTPEAVKRLAQTELPTKLCP